MSLCICILLPTNNISLKGFALYSCINKQFCYTIVTLWCYNRNSTKPTVSNLRHDLRQNNKVYNRAYKSFEICDRMQLCRHNRRSICRNGPHRAPLAALLSTKAVSTVPGRYGVYLRILWGLFGNWVILRHKLFIYGTAALITFEGTRCETHQECQPGEELGALVPESFIWYE